MPIHITPRFDAPTTHFRHSWEGLFNIDQFRHLLRPDTLQHVQMAHDELSGRHVRAVGMLDDYLGTFGRDPQRFASRCQGRSNWHNVFCVIDALEERGVHPVFTTCFMPSRLARKFSPVFGGGASSSPPQDYAQWSQFIIEGARLCLDRYGEDIVKNWYFEVWNEPNLGAFFDGTQNEFWELWAQTYRALKEANADLKIGGPSTARAEWMGEFLEWTRAHDCEPDYLITHVYNNDSESQPLSPFDGPQNDRQSRSPHFATGVMRGVRRLIDEMGFTGEVHWNEWGRSWLPCDPARETANEAAFIVKTMSEASREADYFAYWCLSDIYDQLGFGREAFHGNYGMLSLHGLRKPSYHAHQLLSKLGTERLPVEISGAANEGLTGAIATRGKGTVQVLVYDFDAEMSGEAISVTPRDEVECVLPAGTRAENVRLWRVDSRENNILALWKGAGRPDYLSPALASELRGQSVLKHSGEQLTFETSPHGEVARFTIEKGSIALLEM